MRGRPFPRRRSLALAAASLTALVAGACDRAGDSATRTAGSADAAAEESPPCIVLRYEIDGMHCNGCSGAIVAKVRELKGVRSAHADHESRSGEFEVTDESLDEAIRAAVERLGYTIRRLSRDAPEASEAPRADG